MKAGDLMDVLVSSPPYSSEVVRDRGQAAQRLTEELIKAGIGRSTMGAQTGYGDTDGQLGSMSAGEPPMTETTLDIPTQTWEDCYSDSWKGIITPESFAHPAKFSRKLIERILDFMLAEGWVKPGDVVLVTEDILSEIKKDLEEGGLQQSVVVASPPYADQATRSGSDTPARSGINADGSKRAGKTVYQYGDSEGQLGNMKEGNPP